jgi:hypothetical protein
MDMAIEEDGVHDMARAHRRRTDLAFDFFYFAAFVALTVIGVLALLLSLFGSNPALSLSEIGFVILWIGGCGLFSVIFFLRFRMGSRVT